MEDAAIVEKIQSFPRWHYEFDLRGHKTPIFDQPHINRHRQRESYFFRPLVDLMGGTLAGKRILDLGCNAGYWSLKAIEAGCDYVVGVDGRQMHVEQAKFVFDVKGVSKDRYRFICSDFFGFLQKESSTFDIVLFLGIFYHINNHMTLLEAASRINRDVLIIDTLLSALPGSLLEIRHEPLDEPRNALSHELIMVPTRGAVLNMVHEFGYNAVVLKPEFDSYEGCHDFQAGLRRAFVCAKETRLDALGSRLEMTADELSLGSVRRM